MKKKISAIMVLVCFLLQMNTIAWASTPKSVSNQTITSGQFLFTFLPWLTEEIIILPKPPQSYSRGGGARLG